MNKSVSIIIPCKEINEYTKECIQHCLALDYPDYEIILLPDDFTEKINGVKIIATGPLTPGAKRNIGVRNSTGEICAFIDSDAYPRKDWINNAIKYLKDPIVAGVGGPGLTPKEDNTLQKASGYIYSSFMVGNLSRRCKIKGNSESDDIHSCNFLVKKSVLKEVNGWNEKYWPGEDALICLAIRNLGKKLIDASDVVVYHHRKPLFKNHLKQVWSFGIHRGFFAKKFKGNSLKLSYFAPSILVLSFAISPLFSLINRFFLNLTLVGIGLYLLACLLAALAEVKKPILTLLTWLGIIGTHFTYGISFLIGLMIKELRR
jgi:cellulose synthase/poly-beta-1,6-N-acetylglucosamine synthase-like glycosyltransferase